MELLFAAVVFGAAGGFLGQAFRGRLGEGIVLGLLLGPIGCGLLFLFETHLKVCKNCRSSIPKTAKVCRYCQRDI